MKILGLASAAALAMVMLCAADAHAQRTCGGGGGGGSGGTASTSVVASGGTVSSGAGLLTGPGSWAYDVIRTQAAQRAVAEQKAIAAAKRAAKHNERKADAQAVARQRRQEELYRRSQAKAEGLALASR